MVEKKEGISKSAVVHSAIGITIMILFPLLPLSLEGVTQTGMQVLGIFLGTLYLWTITDSLWPSLLCIAALGLSSYASMNSILESMLGNTTMMLMLFIMILSGALAKYRLTDYIARFFLTRKATGGVHGCSLL